MNLSGMLAAWYDVWPPWLTWEGFKKLCYDCFMYVAVPIFDLFKFTFLTVYEILRDLMLAIIAPLWTAVSSAWMAIAALIAQLYASLSVIHPYLDFANAWAPVDVFTQCAEAYSTLWVVLGTYRTVKSWIPTLSGGG